MSNNYRKKTMNILVKTSFLAISISIFTQPCNASFIQEDSPYSLNFHGGPDTTDWLESHDGVVLSYLQSKNILPKNIFEKRVLDINLGCTATNCSRVLTVKDFEGNDYIIKEVAGSYSKNPNSPFMIEKRLVEKDGPLDHYISLINSYTEETGKTLPILSAYQGITAVKIKDEILPVVVMSKAKGKALKDWKDSFYDIALNQDSEFVSQSIQMGKNIGEQMGQMTRAFITKKNSLLKHSDPSENNFFYDEKTGQFSWIDLPGLTTSSYEKRSYGSIYDDEGWMINNIWRTFFPFDERNGFLDPGNLITNSSVSLKELVDEKGVEILAPHRIGISVANAFVKAYVEQISGLPYYKSAFDKDQTFKKISPYGDDFFMDTIKEHTKEYTEKVEDAFAEKSEGVLDYLFSRKISKQDELSEEEDVRTVDINAVVAEVREEMLNDRRYQNIDPIYNTLRHDSSYNSSGLSNRRNYHVNIKILEKEYTQKRLKNTISDIVKNKLSDKGYDLETLKTISDLVYFNEYSDLLSCQYFQYNTGYKNFHSLK